MPSRRVRRPELAVGLVIVTVCAFGALLWSRSISATTTIVVAARDIQRGDLVSDADLVAGEVRGTVPLGFVTAAEAAVLVGRVALVDIPAGGAVMSVMVDDAPQLGTDDALVGVALERGHAPGRLAVGDVVRVIVLPDPSIIDSVGPVMLQPTARVRGVEPADEFEPRSVVTLEVPVQLAPDVAAAYGVRLARVDR